MTSRTRIAAITVIVGALIAVYVVTRKTDEPKRPDGPTSSASTPPRTVGSPSGAPPAEGSGHLSSSLDAGDGIIRAAWGSGKGQLGHSLMSEGNPEGPMSLVRAGDDLLVLDQVNRRVVRYDKAGRPIATFDTTATTQDINVAKDGSVVMLDRLKEKRVRIVDRNGKPLGELPIPADIKDPGLVTGVFTDGKDVYLEQKHGALVGVGSLDGQLLPEKTQLTGRPSKSGKLLLSVALGGAKANTVTVNAFDRAANKLRFTRVIPFKSIREIVLLDTDAHDVVYVGASADEDITVACLDPGDGHALGRITVAQSMVPEEAFKSFTVGDDGTITSSFMTEDGVEYHDERCP